MQLVNFLSANLDSYKKNETKMCEDVNMKLN